MGAVCLCRPAEQLKSTKAAILDLRKGLERGNFL